MASIRVPRSVDDNLVYLDDEFKKWINDLLNQNHVPGISVAVVSGDQVESAGYGFAQLPDTPATSDTLYCMGSTTKAFTAALIGMIIKDDDSNRAKSARKKVTWTTPVAELLPDDFVTTDDYLTKHISIEDALSHRTGILGHDLYWGPTMGDSSSITRSIRHLGPTILSIRGHHRYNNLMYGVAGHIIEKISQRPFNTLLKERILSPLGMNNSYSAVRAASQALTEDQNLPFARGYYWVEDDIRSSISSESESKSGYYIPDAYIDLAAIGPAGNNISSVKDYAKWAAAMLAASKPPHSTNPELKDPKASSQPSDPVISHTLFRELTTPRSIVLPILDFFPEVTRMPPNPYLSPPLYALGWFINPFIAPGELVIEHGGGLPGFGAGVYIVPNHDFAVVAVGNTSMTANKLCETIVKELLGKRLGKRKEARRPKEPEKKPGSADEYSKKAAQVDKKDVAASTPHNSAATTDKHFDDTHIGLVDHYQQPAYLTLAVSRATDAAALHAEKPESDDIRIERKQKYDTKTPPTSHLPLAVTPIPKRGLDYQLLMHNPRQAAHDKRKIIYGLEMLLRHGDLSDDPFSNLKQVFPPEGEASGKRMVRNEVLWQSQKLDKKGAVVELGEDGQVERLGLQLMRVDGPAVAKDGDEGGGGDDDVLDDGWEDRLVWFQKAGKE